MPIPRPPTHLAQLAAQQRRRRTALPQQAYERQLTCTCCSQLVAVFEASTGARTDLEHQFIDPATYVCTRCLLP